MLELISDLLVAHKDDVIEVRRQLTEEGDISNIDDLWIIRFLIRSNVTKAVRRIKSMLGWRAQHGADEVARRIIQHEMTPKDFPYYDMMVRNFPQNTLFGFTPEGVPFSVEFYGRIQTAQLVSDMTYEQFLEFNLYRLEYIRLILDRISRQTGRLMRLMVVADLAGLGMRQMNATFINYLKRVSADSQEHYREVMGVIFCVNCNSAFTFMWKIIRTALNAQTQEKVNIFGTDFHNTLERVVPRSFLPMELGGPLPSRDLNAPVETVKGLMVKMLNLAVEVSASPPTTTSTKEPPAQPRLSFQKDFSESEEDVSEAEPSGASIELAECHLLLDQALSAQHAYSVPSSRSRVNLVQNSSTPSACVYSANLALNQQLASSSAVYEVRRTHASESAVATETQPSPRSDVGPSASVADGFVSVGGSEVSTDGTSHLAPLKVKRKLLYIDLLFIIWAILFCALVVNSGAVSPEFKLGVAVPLPNLVSIILWSTALVIPLFIRVVYRRFVVRAREECRAANNSVIETTRSEGECRLKRAHHMTVRYLKSLSTDISGLHSQLTSVPAPDLSDRRSWHELHLAIDGLVHRAGVVKGRVREDIEVGPQAYGHDGRRIETAQLQYAMEVEISAHLRQIRSEVSDFILAAAALRRELADVQQEVLELRTRPDAAVPQEPVSNITVTAAATLSTPIAPAVDSGRRPPLLRPSQSVPSIPFSQSPRGIDKF